MLRVSGGLFEAPVREPANPLLAWAAAAGHRFARAVNAPLFDLRVAGRQLNPFRVVHEAIETRTTGVDPRLPREYLGVVGAAARGTWLTTVQAPVFAARHGDAKARARAERAGGRPLDPHTPDGDTWTFTVPNLPLVRFRGPDAVDTGYRDLPGPLMAVYCVKGPTALREVFTAPQFDRGAVPYHVLAQAIGSPSIEATEEAQGAGLFAGCMHSNRTWKEDRLLSLRLVGPKALDGLIPGMVAALDDVVAEVDAHVDAHPGEPVDGTVLMSRIAYRMIIRAAFGDVHDETFERLGQQLRVSVREVLRYFATSRYLTDAAGMMAALRGAKAALAEMGALIRDLDARGALTETQRQSPLLDYVLHGADGTGPAPDDRLYTLLVPILFGGHETTGFTLAWALYHLGRDPRLERRYLDELEAFRAGFPGEVAGPDHYDQRPLQQALLYEIGRRYPPVVAAARMSREAGAVPADPDTGIGAFSYPANALFLAEIAAIHLDPELYPDPMRFDVDRWLAGTEGMPREEAGRTVRMGMQRAEKTFRYVLFGAGPAKCLGQAFNQLECNLVLDHLLERFCFDLVDPGREVGQTRTAISGPEPGGVAVRIRRRAGR